MEEAARRFARRILAVHLALLAVVIVLVFFASREIYKQTREQATHQAEARQSLLASQTARGIEAFYHSIFNDLDLLRQANWEEEPDDEERPATQPQTPPGAPRPPLGPKIDLRQFLKGETGTGPAAIAVRTFFSGILWKQLEGRITHLFGVDRDKLGRKPHEGGGGGGGGALQVLGVADARLLPREIVARNAAWLKATEKAQISEFQRYEVKTDDKTETVDINLVAVPTGERSNRLLVATVPVRIARARFIEKLNTDKDSTNAILADENGTIMIGSQPVLVGRNVSNLRDQQITRIASDYVGKPRRGVETLEASYTLGGENFPPAMIGVEPVNIAGKKWTLMIITPLADVDMIVSRVFKRALFWAFFVVFAMTAILVSTSIQLIRTRIKTERVRHELLTRELSQAREIQLAWLPRQGQSIPSLDLAAVNQPANHISGDFYNWFELPDGRTVITIGDVTGHGMAAAFLMATTQLLVHTTMLRLKDPGRTLQEVNRQLCMQVFNGQFVTMILCVLDIEQGILDVATAGHYPPIVGSEGKFKELPVEPQLVLGVEKDVRYLTERYHLPATASIVLYTDGVLDARNLQGKRFELGRILESLEGKNDSAQALLDSIVAHLNHFRGPRELPDDLTLVCIQTQGEAVRAAESAVVE